MCNVALHKCTNQFTLFIVTMVKKINEINYVELGRLEVFFGGVP